MFVHIPKIKFLEFLIKHKNLTENLMLEIFTFICKSEGTDFEYDLKLKKKIKSTLSSLNRGWKRVERNGNAAKEKYKTKCKNFQPKNHLFH